MDSYTDLNSYFNEKEYEPVPNELEPPNSNRALHLDLQTQQEVIHLTIHDRIPRSFVLPSGMTTQSITQQEYRQRNVLLNQVKTYWVNGVLERSRLTTPIELGLEERTDILPPPFQETLLILGEPGSGKTLMLLKLAQDLIDRAEEDLSQPIPVVFNLSSWGQKQRPIEEWVVQEMVEKYQISRVLAQTWIKKQQLILLLDGLDEVKAAYQEDCVRAFNQFTQVYGLTEIAVCCRTQDYQALSGHLALRSTIYIQPLTFAQIERYLNRSGEPLATLRAALQQDAALRSLATSPSVLSLMSVAYQNCALEGLPKSGTTETLYKQILDAYLEQLLPCRRPGRLDSKTKTLRWLSWLAKRMIQAHQTIFLIEWMQPDWLGSPLRKTLYHLLAGLIIGVISALLLAPSLAGMLDFFMKLLWGSQPLSGNPLSGNSMMTWVMLMAIFGMSAGLIWGFGCAVLGERVSGSWLSPFFSVQIKPIEISKWSWSKAKIKWIHGALWGLLIGLIFGAFIGLIDYARFSYAYAIFESPYSPQPAINSIAEWIRPFSTPIILALVNGLGFSLVFQLLGGLLGGLMGALSGAIVETCSIPNQGMWPSAKNAAILALIGAVCLSLALGVIGLPWGVGVFLGILVGISGAGIACIQHGILRSLLYWNGFAPWNYVRVLNDATSCKLLHQVGGGYIFTHRLLLEYFASMDSV